MNTRSRLSALVIFGASALCVFGQNRTFTGQYSFGDSLSDSGNLFALTGGALPPPPYYQGRFSNGPVFTELLGNSLQAGAAISGRGRYLNFAVGGASVGLSGPVPNLTQQIGIFRGQGFPPEPDDLFTVLMGANDIIAFLSSPTSATNPQLLDTASSLTAQLISLNVELLMALGAKNIVVGGLPNIGSTPRALLSGGPGGPGAALGLRATNAFNNQLRADLATLAASAPADVNLVYIDLQGFLDRVIADHRALGFSNATSFYLAPTALGGGSGDPNGYVFWDDIHPTARTHALFAAFVLEHLNPEPVFGFAASQSVAALALQGLAASALDTRIAQVAAMDRPKGRADAYVSYNYGDGVRGRDGWRPRFSYDAHIVTAGVDMQLGEETLVGGGVNGGRMETEVSQQRGSFTVENATGRLYGLWRGGPVTLVLDASYGGLNIRNIRRPTAIGGLPTRGKTSGHQWGAGIRAGWAVDLDVTKVRPWFGLRTGRAHLDAYTERDIPGLSMAFAKQEAETTQAAVGVDTLFNFKLGSRAARLDLRGAWRDEIGSQDRAVSGRLANNVTRLSSIDIADGDGSGLELGGVVSVFCRKNCSVSLGYTADIRTGERMAHRGMVSVQTGF